MANSSNFLIRAAKTIGTTYWEIRSSLENPQTPLSYPAEWLLDIFNGGRTDSGIRVSEMTALQVSTVLSCVNIVSNGVAALPLYVLEESVKSNRTMKTRALDHPLFDLLRYEPNPEMTSHTFRKTLAAHASLWGNCYAEIQRNNANQIIGLWPRNPARTRPVRLTRTLDIEGDVLPVGTLVYKTSEGMPDSWTPDDNEGKRLIQERIILNEDMIHVPGLSLDGRLGQGTVYLSRQIIGLALATEKYGAKFFGNGAVPRGILEIPQSLEPKQLEVLKRSWQEAHGGENSHKTAVLEAGMKYTPIGIEPEKSQFLATRQFQRNEIASIFSVPSHMVGEADSGRATTEQRSIEFLNFCLQPWLDRFEQEYRRKLFSKNGRSAGKYIAKHDTHKLLYPDADSRTKFYNGGKQWGYFNSNDILEREDMNPIMSPSGEKYWMPVNMQDADDPITLGPVAQVKHDEKYPPKASPIPPAPEVGPDGKPKIPVTAAATGTKRSLAEIYTKVYLPLFRDAYGRIFHRNERDSKAFNRAFAPILYALTGDILRSISDVSGTEPRAAEEFSDAITERLTFMFERSASYTAERVDELCAAELLRACQELEHDIRGERRNKAAVKKPLYMMRHAQTPDDVEGRWSGWNPIDLTSDGSEQAEKNLQALVGKGIKRIVASHIYRSMRTAHLASRILGDIPVTTDWRLAAWNLGILAGEKESFDKISPYVENPDMAIPEGESLNSYVSRFLAGVNDADAKNESTGPTLIITHSSGIATYLGKGKLDTTSEMLSAAGIIEAKGQNKKPTLLAGKLGYGDAA